MMLHLVNSMSTIIAGLAHSPKIMHLENHHSISGFDRRASQRSDGVQIKNKDSSIYGLRESKSLFESYKDIFDDDQKAQANEIYLKRLESYITERQKAGYHGLNLGNVHKKLLKEEPNPFTIFKKKYSTITP